MASGRLSEVFGSETIPLDRYVRIWGTNRMAEKYLAQISDEDLLTLKNYAAGINKMVEQMHVHPLEFYMFGVSFEPFTVRDAITTQYLFAVLMTSDWYFEMTRERLLEIYTKEQVDALIPHNMHEMWDFGEK